MTESEVHDKIMTMKEAISKFIRDGDTLGIGACASNIPYSAVHEIIRSKKRNLHAVQPTSMFEIDMLANAGCLREVSFSWSVRLISGVRGIDRAIKEFGIKINDYSNYTCALALMAGAYHMPFIPCCDSVYHSDLYSWANEGMFTRIKDPFSKEKEITLVRAINPDVAIVHVQRIDRKGNAQSWGPLGTARNTAVASKKVIISAEEIVDEDIVKRSPNETIIPAICVDAIVHEPWAAHPTEVVGYYDFDRISIMQYISASVKLPVFEKWASEWIHGVEDREEYIKYFIHKYGFDALNRLRAKSYPSSAPYTLGSTYQTELEKLNIKLEDIDLNPELVEMEIDLKRKGGK
ncbi:MAG: CoA transferase subunit A [Candidatus Lokiarchaeota archaeon]|nr:CoA transferase subunit A [Candidatus Lokiarchaeota archaeon]